MLWDNRTIRRSPPSAGIDTFSEATNAAFEPPEGHKGNVARAMFYFYTMYSGQSDSGFFNRQKDTLCNWHNWDPADAAEIERSHKIQAAQGNDNPFVLDATLAARTYCQ